MRRALSDDLVLILLAVGGSRGEMTFFSFLPLGSIRNGASSVALGKPSSYCSTVMRLEGMCAEVGTRTNSE